MKSNNARRAWLINGILALVLTAGFCAGRMRSMVHAAGGGWATDGVMANAIDSDAERVVLIDTNKKNMAVYKLQGTGQFRLIAARDYRCDMLLEDTSKLPEVETKNGITAMRARELWDMHTNSKTAQKP
jgi:hypothetical protein